MTVYFYNSIVLKYGRSPEGVIEWSARTEFWASGEPDITHTISSRYYVRDGEDGTPGYQIAVDRIRSSLSNLNVVTQNSIPEFAFNMSPFIIIDHNKDEITTVTLRGIKSYAEKNGFEVIFN